MLYMATRLIVNLSQTYIAMYLTNSLLLPKVGVGHTSACTLRLPGQGSCAWWSGADPLPVLVSHRNTLPPSHW